MTTSRPTIVAVGDNVVDCYRSAGTMYPGGNCVNVSVFAHRAGADSAYIGQVGDDTAGRHIRAALQHEGVGTERLRMIAGPTAWCAIERDGAERVFVDHNLGVSVFTPEPDDLAVIDTADAAHVGATSSLDDWIPRFAQNTAVSYDFSTFRSRPHIRAISEYTELATFSGGDLGLAEASELGRLAVDHGATWVLVTRGRDGAVLRRGAEEWHGSARRIPTVDTLGAGDSFVSRVLVGLLRGEEPHEILDAAAAMAAETCQSVGAFGHPTSLDVALAHTQDHHQQEIIND